MSKILKAVSVHEKPMLICPPEPVAIQEEQPPEPDKDEAAAEVANTKIYLLLDKAQQKAEAIVAEAKAEAVSRLKEADAGCEQIQQQAYQAGKEQGHAEGLVQGREQGLAEMKASVEEAALQARLLLEKANSETQELFTRVEGQIVEIAFGIAKKILQREIEENPLTILPVVRTALDKVRDQENITVRINPSDYELMLQAKNDLQQLVGGEKRLTIVPDTTVSSGGCMIDAQGGTVDATIDNQLLVIKNTLQELVP